MSHYIAIFNIGLKVEAHNSVSGQAETIEDASIEVLRLVTAVASIKYAQSATERTAIVTLVYKDLPERHLSVRYAEELAYHLCGLYRQDAIAYYVTSTEGDVRAGLVGPRAAEWGPFNPAYFLCGDGETLASRLGL